jgi:hypothetical protein
VAPLARLPRDTVEVTTDQVLSVLHGWLGRQVIVVTLIDQPPTDSPASVRPHVGVLERREFPPEVAAAAPSDALHEVEMFNVLPRVRDERLTNPNGITVALHRSLLEGGWVAPSRGLRTVQDAVRIDFWLDD